MDFGSLGLVGSGAKTPKWPIFWDSVPGKRVLTAYQLFNCNCLLRARQDKRRSWQLFLRILVICFHRRSFGAFFGVSGANHKSSRASSASTASCITATFAISFHLKENGVEN